MKRIIAAALAVGAALAMAACTDTDSDVASRNLSTDAEQFKIDRRIVFYNGVTDKYMLEITGRCSVDPAQSLNALSVTCKVGDGEYKKHMLGLSDNTTYFVEQLESANVSTYNYKVVFKPETIIPDVDLSTSVTG